MDYVAALAPLDSQQAPFAPGPELLAEPDATQDWGIDSEVETVAFEEPDLDDAEPLTDTVAVAYDDQPTGEVEPTAAELTQAELTAAEPLEGVPAEADDYFVIGDQGEVIAAPEPDFEGPFKPRTDETHIDRFTRRVADVPVDIRPTEGAMPGDPAAARFAEQALADPRQTGEVPGIVCSYTPWTICFRPLYFEDIALERYGHRVPIIQPALSGARFFASVAALPYKMRVHPPRSCVCSNGFSRCGDCPLPGYGQCVWRWDAALVEAAAVTGFVFILP